MTELIGTGTYTPAEAAKLLAIPARKITRWLRGHRVSEKYYPALWRPEIVIDGSVFLGFRDLLEARVVDAFIKQGLSAIQVRRAISLSMEVLGSDHPLATNRFRTDGREIFLQVIEDGSDGTPTERLLNLFRRQYEFKGVLDPVLRTVDFGDDGEPIVWWPRGRSSRIAIDPSRSFGQPIESTSSIPTTVLATAARYSNARQVALDYDVSIAAVERSVEFESELEQRLAA